jgi:hypothetical protein
MAAQIPYPVNSGGWRECPACGTTGCTAAGQDRPPLATRIGNPALAAWGLCVKANLKSVE